MDEMSEAAKDGSLLAVVPARAGSKGLPGKNWKPLAGLPLIAHTVLMADLCPDIDYLFVSTDSEKIADIARAHGAQVPMLRPSELAQDDTAMWPVLRHALEALEEHLQREFDYLMLLDPTVPTRQPADVAAAFKLLCEHPQADGVIGMSQPELSVFWNSWVGEEGLIKPLFNDSSQYGRRQDVPATYYVNGAMYVWRTSFVRAEEKTWRHGALLRYEIERHRIVNIDDSHSFDMAEVLIKAGYFDLPWVGAGEG